MKDKLVITYSVTHFVVDMLCCFLMMAAAAYSDKYVGVSSELFVFIIYNFFAFVLQFPIGILADKINKNHLFVIAGLSLVLVSLSFGVLSTHVFEMMSMSMLFEFLAIIAGIGNAMFHVGGGISVLNISERKASLSGVFVSTGALGLFLGNMIAGGFDSPIIWSIMILVGIINLFVLCFVNSDDSLKTENEKYEYKVDIRYQEEILILLFLTVCIRGFVGMAADFDWNIDITTGFLAVLCVVLGKMFGGIIGDKVGFMKTTIISLGGSSILFLLGDDSMICGLLALFLFNMTMPITLTMLVNTFYKAKGRMFGLTTVALFIGFIFSLIFSVTDFDLMVVEFVACILSLSFMFIGVSLYHKDQERMSKINKGDDISG